jgi:protein-S-isoprenylcysteine O-methyltransferase Ste14
MAIGASIALQCIWEFAWLLVFVALVGEAIVFPNLTLTILVMLVLLFAIVSLFVLGYEEPTLRRTFGTDYETYTRAVRRWIPRLRPFDNP